jgi:protein phosphatase PTC1
VCSDQEAVDLVRHVPDPQEASEMLVDYALSRFSSDNLSCMIVRFDPTGKFEDIDKVERNTETETKDPPGGEAIAVGNSTTKDDEIKPALPSVGEGTETVG